MDSTAARAPTEMELRVASILEDESAPWMNCLSKAQASNLARAAIRAMREPTEAMLDAPEIVMDEPWNIKIGWQEMIDAASPP